MTHSATLIPARARHAWWVVLAVGAAGFALIWLLAPHGRADNTLGLFVLKLVPFLCLSAAVALFPLRSPRLYPLLYVVFVALTAYVLPRISYFYYGDVDRADGDSFYTHMYTLLYPGVVLAVAAAYRLGGGTPGRCLKIALTGMVIVFSGLLDLMWFVVNPVGIPAAIDAPHITVLTGGPISFGATIAFALAHAPIVVGLNLLPLDRWLGRWMGADR